MRESERERAFLDAVCCEVRWKNAHAAIREELLEHSEDQKIALEKSGLSLEAAETEALKRLGEPQALGMLFDASFRPAPTLGVLLPVALYALLGILFRVFLYSMAGSGAWIFFVLAVIAGFGGIFLALRINFLKAAHLSWIAYLGFLVLVIATPALSAMIAGQMPEESALYLILRYLWPLFPLIYGLLLYRLRGLGFVGVLLALALFGVPLLVSMALFWSGFYLEALACFACVGMLLYAIHAGFFSCKRRAATAFVIFVFVFVVAGFLIAEPHRLGRVLAVIDPGSDPLRDGWLVLRMRELLSHAALFGQGGTLPLEAQQIVDRFGESTMSQSVLLAMIAYRVGLVAAALPVFGLFAWVYYGFSRMRALGSRLGRMLALGILLVFLAQAIFSIAAFLGYPLWYSAVFPFLSDDTWAFLMNLLLAGFLVSLLRTDGLYRDTSFRNRKLRLRLE